MAEYKINDNRLEKYSYSFPSIRDDLNVVVPDGVRIIGNRAFEDRNIETVVIPDGVEIIESYAFSSCRYLKKVVLPQTLKTIEERAFWRCESLTEVTVSSVIENIGMEVFYRCGAIQFTAEKQEYIDPVCKNDFRMCLTNVER